MNLFENVRIAWHSLMANKLRSFLTMLGIIIGVAAVIALLAIGYGFEQYITGQFQGLGSNILFVIPGRLDNYTTTDRQRSHPLTMADAQALADPFLVSHVAAVAPEYSQSASVAYGSRQMGTSVKGITPEFQRVRNFEPLLGQFITQEQVDRSARVVVLGATVVQQLFEGGEYPLGQTIKINDLPFKVVGILQPKGGSALGADADNVVLVPISTAQSRLYHQAITSTGQRQVSIIHLQVANEDQMETVSARITTLLRQRHGIRFNNEDDFTIINQADLLEFAGNFAAAFTFFLGTIAGISLVVGGIGIMNIMLVSVAERTREIGIRKAVGARRNDILLQFLMESVVLSFLGGRLGISLGLVASSLVPSLMPDITAIVRPHAILLAAGFAVVIGLFFGIYPASRAARLRPIEALRYE